MKSAVWSMCLLGCFLAQAQDESFKLHIKTDPLPDNYRIKVKIGLIYEVVDILNAFKGKRRTPNNSDVLFSEASTTKLEFEVTFKNNKSISSIGNVLTFKLPRKIQSAPNGLYGRMLFPSESEIYHGTQLVTSAKHSFGMSIDKVLSKKACFFIQNCGKKTGSSDVNVGVGVASCDLDWSKDVKVIKR